MTGVNLAVIRRRARERMGRRRLDLIEEMRDIAIFNVDGLPKRTIAETLDMDQTRVDRS